MNDDGAEAREVRRRRSMLRLVPEPAPADGGPVGCTRGPTACLARGCPVCGPWIRERNLAHDARCLAGHQVTRLLVAGEGWPAVRAAILAAEGRWVAYPQRPGAYAIYPELARPRAVYATAGIGGTAVEDLGAWLAADYDRLPGGARISRSPRLGAQPDQAGAMTEDRRSAWLDAVALITADLDDDQEATAAILAGSDDPGYLQLVVAFVGHIGAGAGNGGRPSTAVEHLPALRAMAEVLAHSTRLRIQAEHGTRTPDVLAALRRLALDAEAGGTEPTP